MNIGMIAPYYFPNVKGGGEVSLKILSEALVEKGHHVVVVTFDGREKKEEVISRVRIVRYSGLAEMAQPLTLLPQVLSVLKRLEQEVDLFHMYNMSTIPGAGLYKLLGGSKPVVATLNSYIGFCPIGSALCIGQNKECNLVNKIECLNSRKIGPRILHFPYAVVYPLLTSLSKKLDAYIAPSKTVKYVYACQGYATDRIVVVPYFVPINARKASLTSKRTDPKIFRILYVGKLDVHKGVDILIQAFFHVVRGHRNSNLIIVGDGPEFERCKKLAYDLGIFSKVFFAGKVSVTEVWKYYSIADVFVHPAIWFEPFGRTILEALSFQLPLIVSNVGAPPEIIKQAGLVFEKGNVADLVQKIELVIENDALRKRLISNSSAVLDGYPAEKLLSKIVRLYERVLENQD